MKMLLPLLLSVLVMVSAARSEALEERCEACNRVCGPKIDISDEQPIGSFGGDGGKRADALLRSLALPTAPRYYIRRYPMGREEIQRLLNTDLTNGDSYKHEK